MKASSCIEGSQLQNNQQDTFLDKEQRLKLKLKQKQEERQQRRHDRSGSFVSSTEQQQQHDEDGDDASNQADRQTETAIVSSSKSDNGTMNDLPSTDVAINSTQGSVEENPSPPDRSNGKLKHSNPSANPNGEKRRHVEQQHHRSRHSSRGRGSSPSSQKRERHAATHPRGSAGQNWNMMRDDYGRAIPCPFQDDPHHPGHFYDPYYEAPPPPYYPLPPRGGDYYMRDPYYGATPRGAAADQQYHPHHHPSQRGAGAGRYHDATLNARRQAPDYNGSRRNWDPQQQIIGTTAMSSEAAAAATTSKPTRSAHSRSRSIASSTSSSHASETSYSSALEDNRSSGRRSRHRHRDSSSSSRSFSSRSSRSYHRSVSPERPLQRPSRIVFSSDESGNSRSRSKKRRKHRKPSRREEKSKRKKRSSRSHKRHRDTRDNEEEEKRSTSSIHTKGSGDEAKEKEENSTIKSTMASSKDEQPHIDDVEGTSTKRSRSANLEEKNSAISSMKSEQDEEEAVGQKEDASVELNSNQKQIIKRRTQEVDIKKNKKKKKTKRSSRSSRSPSRSSSTINNDASSHSSRSSRINETDDVTMLQEETEDQSAATKDQRTIFISQLVMRATEHDVRKYLRKYVGVSKVKQVIFLQDKRTGRHKGCTYVELGLLADVKKAVEFDGKVPSFQRFPILIKPSEAEKNYSSSAGTDLATVDSVPMTTTIPNASITPTVTLPSVSTIDGTGKKVVIQNVYIGSIDRLVTQAQLHAIFSQFGQLTSLHLPADPATGLHRGYAFLAYSDAKSANLAIKTMAGQSIAGRQLKTGWASQASAGAIEVVTSDELPEDYAERVQKVNAVLVQVNGTGLLTIPLAAATAAMMPDPSAMMMGSSMPLGGPTIAGVPINVQSVAEAALNAALGTSSVPSFSLVNSDSVTAQGKPSMPETDVVPTRHILIHNMFNKDKETEDGWWDDIREDVTDECTIFGKVERVLVMHELPDGKVYVSFQNAEMAKQAASALEGRWFDQRQLHVEFVKEEDVP